tara:strand:+ start:138 stop:419 length:282 start_codon:yes stop_codon:yes gene_type:complete
MKILSSILLLLLFSGCLQGTALLGPAVTIASTGNVYHAGLSYGSNKAIKQITGKTTVQNIQEILTPKKNENNTLKSVKKKLAKVSKINIPPIQ